MISLSLSVTYTQIMPILLSLLVILMLLLVKQLLYMYMQEVIHLSYPTNGIRMGN